MTVNTLINLLRTHWVAILVAVVVAIGIGGLVHLATPPTYTAQATLYVSAQSTDTTSSAYQGAQLSERRVASYVQLVNNQRIIGSVARQLGLDETAVAKSITANSPTDSVLINISSRRDDPDQAAQIANLSANEMTRLVDELEKPTDINALPAVTLKLVERATPPIQPSSVGLATVLALGLIVGLVVGVGFSLLRESLDSTIKTVQDAQDATHAANLGEVGFDPAATNAPVALLHQNGQSRRAENYRQLRTNLQFTNLDRRSRVIAVTSAVASEGKTTTVVNLAVAFATAGQRVVLIDGDLRRPRIAPILSLEGQVGLTSVLTERLRIEDAVQHWHAGSVDVLASGPLPPNPSELLASDHMRRLLQHFRERYDVVLVDTPPLLPVTDAAALAPATDGVLLICRHGTTTKKQLSVAAQAVNTVDSPLLGTVITMTPASRSIKSSKYNSYYSNEAASMRRKFI